MQVTHNDIIEAIKQAKVIDEPENLRSDMNLTDQGIDSLGMFSVILALQEKYDIEIPDADIDKLNSMDDLRDYLNNSTA